MDKYNRLLEIFDEIVKIPRDSGKEEKIAKYVCNFANDLGLEYSIDDYFNVIVKRDPSPGMEDKKSLMFQAHLDMVCEKTSDSNHNFDIDPIEIVKSDEVYRAKDTTLGADDGIGISTLLMLMEDKDIKLPLTYFVFTVQEETGMDGSKNIDLSNINVDYLINLDSEEEDSVIIGCAAGETLSFENNFDISSISDNIYKLSISGLKGGHSGVDIDKDRINANLVCASILSKLSNVKLISFTGGTKTNAIPNSAEVIFSTDNIDENLIDNTMNSLNITDDDKNISINIDSVSGTYNSLSIEDSNKVISLILDLKQNVIYKSEIVDTSGNVAIVNLTDGNIIIYESLRSNINSKLDEVKNNNISFAEGLGFKVTCSEGYPGWDYDYNSTLLKKYVSSYKATHSGEEPIITPIHAGLECGLLKSKLNSNVEIISIGPTLIDVHTVDETLYLDSCRKLISTLYDFINNL